MTHSDSPLIEADALHRLVGQGNVCVVDCRFSLADTGQGLSHYRESHIPGAHYAHLDNDLSSPIVEGSGRHPLPERQQVVQLFRRCGADDHTRLVFYDDAGGAIAARAWWLSQWLGHAAAQVLNGGFQQWTGSGFPLSSEIPSPAAGRFSDRETRVQVIDVSQVLDPTRLLVDARDPERYAGLKEPLDPVAGHIPGAANRPFTDNLGQDKRFLPRDDLRRLFNTLENEAAGRTLTHYCGSGVTAAHNILAMTSAGMNPGALYAGSWSEWVQDPERPVATA